VLVIATGFAYSEPIKGASSVTTETRRAQLQSHTDKVSSAQSILVVGGGAVAIELMGEFACAFPDGKKKLTLITRGKGLLPRLNAKAGELAETFLKSKGVDVQYGQTYEEFIKGKENEFDAVFICSGQTYHSEFLKENFAKSIAPNGQIFVNNHLQITGSDPTGNGDLPALKENVFALGDINKTSINEEKAIF